EGAESGSATAVPQPATPSSSGVPLAGATPPEGYTGATPRVLAAADRQQDWRQQLKTVIWGYERYARRAAEHRTEALPRIQQFLDEKAMPALERIRAELERNGREAAVERDSDGARLTVWREGQEEFNFNIRCLVREPLTFAFPEINLEPDQVHPRAEIVLPTGRTGDWALDELSREKIYDEFVNAYAHWMGW
ncbi:MAG: hypothetical protein KGY53_12365, partial [Wenzhouxiangellaceae bacterium]|nr:hypothetical protein [Wenzhouxiangellaceae bacterium]